MPSSRLVAGALISVGLLACSEEPGGDGPEGDLAYYCAERTAAWCPAYLDCDPFGFPSAFRSMEECLEQSEEDCLDPPEGISRCEGATVEETDACVGYVEANHPDGCSSLFGVSADMSPCEAICE
jgi:hypothetical protein